MVSLQSIYHHHHYHYVINYSLGSNAQLTYDIEYSDVNITELLTINQYTGVISKMGARNFDRETTGDINLTVIAYDNGSPQLNSTAQVLIILLVSFITISSLLTEYIYIRILMNILQCLDHQITPLMCLRMLVGVLLLVWYQQLIRMKAVMQ